MLNRRGSRGGVSSSQPFFFQAEDGIRDVAVTGVQTCALPIFIAAGTWLVAGGRLDAPVLPLLTLLALSAFIPLWEVAQVGRRSEKRRVGKEGRSRWAPYH